jgi:hydrogenase maturation factor
MSNEMPEIGKISPEIFNELVFPRLGAKSADVLVGPQHGVDVGIVEIGDKVASFTTDPVFIVPEFGWERAAWFHQQCERLGISIICGHTARYENCHYPMVGGATMVGVGEKDEYVTPRLARAGDKIIITKGPAIEATGIFATMFPQLIEKKFGLSFSQKAQQIFYKMSVVEDAMTAVSVGVRENGVTAMHDATECGIWGGLYEIAQAANLGVRIEKEQIVVEDCVPEICQHFSIDPYASISEGTLIITCRKHKAQEVVETLSRRGINSSIVGELTESKKGMVLVEGGKEKKLRHPIVDPFWRAFYDALQ